MATFDFTNSEAFLSMNSAGTVDHASQGLHSSSLYFWNTTNSTGQVQARSFANDIVATDNTLPSAGTINVVTLSYSGDKAVDITGLSVSLPALTASEESFWRAVLSGSTTFLLSPEGSNTNGRFLAGDFVDIAAGEKLTGSKDIFIEQETGGYTDNLAGDAFTVAATARLTGGDDSITAGGFAEYLSGDAYETRGRTDGGDDFIRCINGNDTQGSYVAGDVIFLNSGSTNGGDDTIIFEGIQGGLYSDGVAGDVYQALAGTTINGGDDKITASNGDVVTAGSYLSGDVNYATAAVVNGGDDSLAGSSLADNLIGDVQSATGDSTISGGADYILGGAGNDTISGEVGGGNNYTISAGGDDTLNGGAGNDSINGQQGDDRLIGGTGNDTLNGEDGIDTVAFNTVAAGVSVDLSTLGNIGTAWGQGVDLLNAIENVSGSSLADAIVGSGVANVLAGLGGDDMLIGEDGRDTISGGSGNDKILGGQKGDLLIGSAGRDTISGGGGPDRFDYNALSDSGAANTARDTIIGFQHNADQIDLSNIDAKAHVSGNNAFSFIGASAFTAEGQVRVIQFGGDTIILVNTEGAGGAEMSIKLDGLHTVTAGDFIL